MVISIVMLVYQRVYTYDYTHDFHHTYEYNKGHHVQFRLPDTTKSQCLMVAPQEGPSTKPGKLA